MDATHQTSHGPHSHLQGSKGAVTDEACIFGWSAAANVSGRNHSLGQETKTDPCSTQPKGKIEAGRL